MVDVNAGQLTPDEKYTLLGLRRECIDIFVEVPKNPCLQKTTHATRATGPQLQTIFHPPPPLQPRPMSHYSCEGGKAREDRGDREIESF